MVADIVSAREEELDLNAFVPPAAEDLDFKSLYGVVNKSMDISSLVVDEYTERHSPEIWRRQFADSLICSIAAQLQLTPILTPTPVNGGERP